MTDINIFDLFVAGQQKLQAVGNAEEATKHGTLRAGNTGMQTEQGLYIGPCPSLTYLRYKGVDVKGLEDDGDSGGAAGRELMFEAGRVNEDLWTTVLEQTWDGVILRESEIATHWKTQSNVSVTGRPDLVLCDQDSIPQLGLELKQVSSFWTAYEVKFNGKPKFAHLLQAAHYSWQLGVSFELWYTSRTDYHVADWIKQKMPQPGELNSEYVAYTYHRINGDGKRSKISKLEFEKHTGKKSAEALKCTPFIQGYRIEIIDGVLHYSNLALKKPKLVRTEITTDNIIRYYQSIVELDCVPDEPTLLKADGTKANYKARDYCPLGELCCAYQVGRDIKEWTDEVKQAIQDK